MTDLEQKIQEARDAGYTEEEIQAYLSKPAEEKAREEEQPVPAQVPMDRSEEYKGLAQGMALEGAGDVLKYGAIGGAGYGLYQLGKKALDRPMPAIPVAPVEAPRVEPMFNEEWDRRLKQPPPAQPVQPAMPQKDYMGRTEPTMGQTTQQAQPARPISPNVQAGRNYITEMRRLAAEMALRARPGRAGPGMPGTPGMPIQIQEAPDIAPELRQYRERNIYDTFNR